MHSLYTHSLFSCGPGSGDGVKSQRQQKAVGWEFATLLPLPGGLGFNTCAWSSALPRKHTSLGTRETRSLLAASLGNLRPQCQIHAECSSEVFGGSEGMSDGFPGLLPQALPCCYLQPGCNTHTHTHTHCLSLSLSLSLSVQELCPPLPASACHGLSQLQACQPSSRPSCFFFVLCCGKGPRLASFPGAQHWDLALLGSVTFLSLGFRPKQLC